MHETEICIKTPTLVSILSFDASSNSNRIEFQREKTTKGFLRDFFYPVIRRIVILRGLHMLFTIFDPMSRISRLSLCRHGLHCVNYH